MTTLVVGGTGFLGRQVCLELAAQGRPVAAMVRSADGSKVDSLRAAGVQLVEGDLKDPASVERACQGMDSIVSTASASITHGEGDNIRSVDRDGQMRLVDAAGAAGVSRFVYISFSSNLTTEAPLTAAKREVERYLAASPVDHTILRCGFLMDIMVNPLVGFDFAKGTAVVYGSGDEGLSLVAIDDVARMVALCLERPEAANATIEFGGPDPVTQHDVVRIFEEVSGRTFEVQHVPEAGLVGQWEQASDPLGKSMGALMLDYARGDAIDMAPTLARFPIEQTSVRDYAMKVLDRP